MSISDKERLKLQEKYFVKGYMEGETYGERKAAREIFGKLNKINMHKDYNNLGSVYICADAWDKLWTGILGDKYLHGEYLGDEDESLDTD